MKKTLITGLITMSIVLTGCAGESLTGKKEAASSGETASVEEIKEEIVKEINEDLFDYEYKIEETKNKEGKVALSYAYSYPVFKNPDNKESINKINNSIKEYIQKFTLSTETDFSYLFNDEFTTSQLPQGSYMEIEVKRCDEKIISVESMQSTYSGGVHSYENFEGMTFNAETGQRLTFKELSSLRNSYEDAIYHETFNNIKAMANLPGYVEASFDISDKAINEYLYERPNRWYLGNSGLVFMANPYELGAYSHGSIRFNVPYDRLSTLDSMYKYEGNFLGYSRINYEIKEDVDGNDIKDDVLMTCKYNSVSGKYEGNLSVNKVDFSDKLIELQENEEYKDEYFVVDLDEEDNFKEIAIQTTKGNKYRSYTDEKTLNNYEGRTYFYRCSEDLQVEYLGYIDRLVGDIRVDYKNCKLKKD